MPFKPSKLFNQSKQIIKDCCLENGAIVAANTDKDYYPKNANNYRFIWPRDTAFILYAAKLTNNTRVAHKFNDWLLTRAEGFAEQGMLFQRYATNGSRDPAFGHQYQPDQSGALLWSLCEIFPTPNAKISKTISLLAESLCNNIQGKCFVTSTFDLWEERQTFPCLQDSFTYTLAACSYGLQCAAKLFSNSRWLNVAMEMRNILINLPGNNYYRSHGRLVDQRIDASLLGLVWPFAAVPIDAKLQNTIQLIIEKLLTPEGIKRYENDEYDGTLEHLQNWKKGGGGWPLLTFWYVIVLAKLGRLQEAKKIFKNYSRKFPSGFIPEQLFNNQIQQSVSPLCWSHAMFIIAEDIVRKI